MSCKSFAEPNTLQICWLKVFLNVLASEDLTELFQHILNTTFFNYLNLYWQFIEPRNCQQLHEGICENNALFNPKETKHMGSLHGDTFVVWSHGGGGLDLITGETSFKAITIELHNRGYCRCLLHETVNQKYYINGYRSNNGSFHK